MVHWFYCGVCSLSCAAQTHCKSCRLKRSHMTTEQIIGLSVTLLLMLIGFIGSIVPGLPGPPLVLAAAIGHRLWFGEHSVGPFVLTILAVLALASIALDYFAGMYGAKKFGATWRGVLGALIGGLVGMFFGLPGIIIGP